MPKPFRIYLVRHGQSASNVDMNVNRHTANHVVPLSPEGFRQAETAGKALARMLGAGAPGRLRVWNSPYLRTRQTHEGRFFARMPQGESRFDVACRVHQVFGTLHRDAERHGISTVVIVAHGVTNRAFTMEWMHYPFEWFEKEPNPANCSIRLLEDGTDRGYVFPGFRTEAHSLDRQGDAAGTAAGNAA